MTNSSIPLSEELTSGWKALGLIRHHLGIAQTAAVLSSMMGAMRQGEPFGHLPKPIDRREALTRKQLAPMVLLYRSLGERMESAKALRLVRDVTVEGSRVFLRRLIGLLDRDRLVDMSAEGREAFGQEVAEKFFCADLSWEEISGEQLKFTVTTCRYPQLCEQAAASELAPLFCEGDRIFFGQDIRGVKLIRPLTIAGGAGSCPFTLRWIDPTAG